MYLKSIAPFLLLTSPVLSNPTPGKDKDCDITVKPGQSIQSAIDSAKPGSKIVVQAGTYHEQITITTSNIHLVGQGAVLYPPKGGYKPNFCTGLSKTFEKPQGDDSDTDAGICIYGKGFELGPYVRANLHKKISKTGKYIEGVKVTGFEIHDFNGEAIALIGGKDASIKHNKLVDNGQYGFLTVGSYSTLAQDNIVTASVLGFIALCMDDAKGAMFKKNNISNHYIALCTQTNGGLVEDNTAKDCCYGPFVDPGIVGAKIIGNTISGRNKICPEAPPVGPGAGIAILGAKDTLVEKNLVEKWQVNNMGFGLLVADDPITGAKAQGNTFRKNEFRQNDLDILADGVAAANKFDKNVCKTSLPGGLCGN
ncbi:pectin lyase fold/virulence factor [Phaeosphaeria sp. MPI-PUGE-AT-0046c]|nr:pectin lyase fold/virulence factor [Phaeosphaeria sp. MPI-PUGE-AT-0046c]